MFFEILKASKGLYTDNIFAEMWGKRLAGQEEWQVTEITGYLPLTFLAKGEALENYRIYGTENGAGVQTGNLFDYTAKDTDKGFVNGRYLVQSGDSYAGSIWNISEYIEVQPDTVYTITPKNSSSSPSIVEYDINKVYIAGHNYGGNSEVTITTSSTTKYVRASIAKGKETEIMLTPGSTAPASYIPPGYQIPLTVTSGVTYMDEDTFVENSVPSTISGLTVFNILELTLEPNTDYTLSSNYYGATMASWYITNEKVFGALNSNTNGCVANAQSRTVKSTAEGKIYIWGRARSASVSGEKLIGDMTATDYAYLKLASADYNLYIGSTKLGEEEYVDYESGKIYRTIGLITSDGKDFITADNNRFCVRRNNNCLKQVRQQGDDNMSKNIEDYLEPTDPPAPFPAITAYKGENTLSSAETVGSVTIKGKIKTAQGG